MNLLTCITCRKFILSILIYWASSKYLLSLFSPSRSTTPTVVQIQRPLVIARLQENVMLQMLFAPAFHYHYCSDHFKKERVDGRKSEWVFCLFIIKACSSASVPPVTDQLCPVRELHIKPKQPKQSFLQVEGLGQARLRRWRQRDSNFSRPITSLAAPSCGCYFLFLEAPCPQKSTPKEMR